MKEKITSDQEIRNKTKSSIRIDCGVENSELRTLWYLNGSCYLVAEERRENLDKAFYREQIPQTWMSSYLWDVLAVKVSLESMRQRQARRWSQRAFLRFLRRKDISSLKCKYSTFCFILFKHNLALNVDLLKGKLAFAKMSESYSWERIQQITIISYLYKFFFFRVPKSLKTFRN